jgi:hypothetical protein
MDHRDARHRDGYRRRTRAGRDAVLPESAVADPDKARVIACFRDLVDRGHAQWRTLDDGSIELRLNSGETYLLGPKTIARIA